MKGKYIGPTDDLVFINGKEYEIVASDATLDAYYATDEVGDDTMVSKDSFQITEGDESEIPIYHSARITHAIIDGKEIAWKDLTEEQKELTLQGHYKTKKTPAYLEEVKK